MKRTRIFPFSFILFLLPVFFLTSSVDATTHIINFGGLTLGHHYSPSFLTVEVGDTIIWKGDFSADNMVSTTVPSGAQSVSLINSGLSFTYTIEAPGTYYLQNNAWAALGMRDTINAIYKSHGSVTNEGKEFFLGMLYPTYNNIAASSLFRQFATYALVTSYYDNVIYFSYFDASGNELTPTKKVVGAHQLLQIPLNIGEMRADSFPETAVYKSCHIVSQNPVSVQYLSRGANSGGSYLALPVLGLGKNYIVASYPDDGGGAGALYGRTGLPTNYDVAGGDFMVIATDDVTSVNITPAATTSGGKVAGAGFNIGLSKGQCYFVRSDGKNSDNDISGTIIQSSKPIVVISGHEDANDGDVGTATSEARDMMIEQMIPVEYLDTGGYYGIPFTQSSASSSGDGYRVFTFDNATAKVQADVQGVSGGYQFSPSRLHGDGKFDITSPVDIYSTNGHKISVMQYDERSQPTKSPYPAPSMMTIIPHSRWRTVYNFSEFDPSGLSGVNASQYVGIISDSIVKIKISADGAGESSLPGNGFTNLNLYGSVSNTYGGKGQTYDVGSHSYYLHSDFPFICYAFGMSQLTLPGGFGGGYNFYSEYAAPAGTELNTGIPPAFKVTVNSVSNCGGWDVCVTDTSAVNPGVKAVMLANDPDGIYYQRPGSQFSNVSFDSASPDFKLGELHPDPSIGAQYCFRVNIDKKLNEAIAPLGIIDQNGNGLLIRLYRSAPAVNLSTIPASIKSDSIFFQSQKVGTQICTTFVVKNTAPAGGSPLMFTNVKLTKTDAVFAIQSVTPVLPAQIQAQDSLVVQLCYTSKDSLRHQDSLLISNDCFTIPISLDAHSSTGLIQAEDIAFGSVDSGKEVCKPLMIRNIGSAPFTLLASPVLSDTVDFAIDPTFLAKLPLSITPGGKVSVQVCFHPKQSGSDSAHITWATDIDAVYANSGKNYSGLSGTGLTVIDAVSAGEAAANTLSVHPNPAAGTTAVVSFKLPSKQKAILAIYDVLGREISHINFSTGASEFELPIGLMKQGLYYVRLTSDDVVLTQKLEVVR